MCVLRLILSDQLSHSLPSLQKIDADNDIILFCETFEEATYVKHHKQKLVYMFSSMRHFAKELQKKYKNVKYITIDHQDNLGSLDKELERAVIKYKPEKIMLTSPGEYRLLEKFSHWQKIYHIPVTILDDTRYLCSTTEFKEWARGKKQLRMENFYHYIRIKHKILLEKNNNPVGGKWNYDTENRKPLKSSISFPVRTIKPHDKITTDVITVVEKMFNDHFGEIGEFKWAVTRQEALALLHQFIDSILPNFGDYQDAMSDEESFLFHSLLSPYINAGLLLPLEICQLAEKAYDAGTAPLNAVEGFIRQIIGWREYIRGVYWLHMPSYADLNYFQASRKLPDLYWSANTKMNCLKSVVEQTQQNAYSHHIQRLMITGNFALIAGLNPKEVCDWYLMVYLDAYDWVELPNTLGMSLFGDGGLLGSKPYAASGKYISRMSNFCKNCHYSVKETVGKQACPFNSLYWGFIEKNQVKLRSNLRLTFTYATLDKMDNQKRTAVVERANECLDLLQRDEL